MTMQTKNTAASHTAPKKKPTYPWAEIKKEYLENPDVTLASLERKYGMNHTTISHRATKEGWQQLRNEIAIKSNEKTIDEIVDYRSEINKNAMQALALIAQKTAEGMTRTAALDSRSLKDYMSIIKDLKDIGAISIEAESSEIRVVFEDFDAEEVGDDNT